MNTRRLRKGSIELIIVAVIAVAVAGLVAWRLWSTMHDGGTDAATDSKVSEITTKQDLATADSDLGKLDVDSDDLTQLDSQLSF